MTPRVQFRYVLWYVAAKKPLSSRPRFRQGNTPILFVTYAARAQNRPIKDQTSPSHPSILH